MNRNLILMQDSDKLDRKPYRVRCWRMPWVCRWYLTVAPGRFHGVSVIGHYARSLNRHVLMVGCWPWLWLARLHGQWIGNKLAVKRGRRAFVRSYTANFKGKVTHD